MNEKALEKKLREKIKKMGGIAIKFSSPHYTGMPDRIILMPKERIYFVELKTTGKKPTERQKKVMFDLQTMGFSVYIVNDERSFNQFMEEVMTGDL